MVVAQTGPAAEGLEVVELSSAAWEALGLAAAAAAVEALSFVAAAEVEEAPPSCRRNGSGP